MSMSRLLWVCLGSALGGGARYLLASCVTKVASSAFPFGTYSVNVIGSFLMGFIMYAGVERAALPETTRLALTVGVLGGFTTYSSFAYETMRSLQSGASAIALANVLATVVSCLLACLLGWAIATWIWAS